MILLNKLKAAPGQPNRGIITHFLFVKKWIKDGQTPDDWPLVNFPKGDVEFLKLTEEIDQFHMRQMSEVPK